MAKIPMGDFGQRIAPTTQTPTASAAQLDGGLSDAVQRVGNTAMAIGQSQLDEQAMEAKRLKLQQETRAEHEVRQAQDLRDRLEATTAVKGLSTEVKLLAGEIQQDIAAGKVSPNDTALEFQSRSEKLMQTRLEGMHPELAAQVRAGTLDELGNAKILALNTAAAQTRSMAKADLLKTREEFERSALADRPKALQQYQQILEHAAPDTGLTPEQVQVELQSFREKTARASADALINGARDDPKSLAEVQRRINSDEFHDLSPDQRGPLESRVLQRLQHLENEKTQRILRQQGVQDRRERVAERSMGELEKMFDLGQVPDAQTTKLYADQVAGTSMAPRFRELVQQSAERAGFATLSPDAQRQELMKLRADVAQNGSSEKKMDRIQRFENIERATAASVEADGLTHGARTGMVTLKPLNLGDLNTLGAQLTERVQAAETVSARVRREVAPLTKPEALQVADALSALPAMAREGAVVSLAKNMTVAQGHALAALIKDREPALGAAMFQAATNPNGEALRLILQGQDARKAGRIKEDDAMAKTDAQSIARKMEEISWGTPAARDFAAMTANAVLDGMRDKGGASVSKAIELATGGVGQWNDSKVPLPRGMDSRQFERRLDGLKADPQRLSGALGLKPGQALSLGGAPVTVEQLSGQLGKVRLISAGPGRYAMEAGGQIVLAPNGRPARLNLEK
jgi:hypothetical protein